MGEWLDDPFTNNHVFCHDNSLMEVGDPLEVQVRSGGLESIGMGIVLILDHPGKPRASANNAHIVRFHAMSGP